jgi:hypothetical protein
VPKNGVNKVVMHKMQSKVAYQYLSKMKGRVSLVSLWASQVVINMLSVKPPPSSDFYVRKNDELPSECGYKMKLKKSA